MQQPRIIVVDPAGPDGLPYGRLLARLQPQEVQVELTLEEVIDLLPKFGFRLRTSEMRKSHYT